MKKLDRRKDADLATMKAEIEALRARAKAAENAAEAAVRRRTELQEVLNAAQAKTEWGNPDTFGSTTSEEGTSVAFATRRSRR